MFQPQFADLVKAGTKCQTIRPVRKNGPIRIGQPLSLRAWTGKPYRSKQVELRQVICRFTCHLRIDLDGITWPREPVMSVKELARTDGFVTFAAMQLWFEKIHGLPFTGVLIQW